MQARRIGHFGFFRDQFQTTLWTRVTALLQRLPDSQQGDGMSIKTATLNGVATIEIARPEKKNAITVAMYLAMADALRAAQDDAAVRAVLITGQPGIFTSGNDLEDFMQRPRRACDSPAFLFMRALIGCDKPVVAAVTGAAIGIGTTMLLHCDFVYVSDEARLAMPFVSLGLVPEFASSLVVPQLMGSEGGREAAARRPVQRRRMRSSSASPTRCCRPARSSTTRGASPSASTRCRPARCAKPRS